MQPHNSLLANRRLETLVENQTSYSLRNAEMHIFETHKSAEQVHLSFHEAVFASMIQGKKIMHLNGMDSFDFTPGESVVLPPNELMCIDFPEATMNEPTICLALAISDEMIAHTVQQLNENNPKENQKNWSFTNYNFHLKNDVSIQQISQRLIFLFAENHPSKDIFVDSMLKELIVRILQSENRIAYSEKSADLLTNNRIAYAIDFVRRNLTDAISVEELSKKACMSESNFYKVFKTETGISPVEFINRERIAQATRLLSNSKKSIKEVCWECGFNSVSYFNRLFKRKKNLTPDAYRKKYRFR